MIESFLLIGGAIVFAVGLLKIQEYFTRRVYRPFN